MSRDHRDRLRDILTAIDAIGMHRCRAAELGLEADDQLLIDAVVRQLAIIGEAAAHLPEAVTRRAPDVPWQDIKGMRLHLDHGYHKVSTVIVLNTVEDELDPLRYAVSRELHGEE